MRCALDGVVAVSRLRPEGGGAGYGHVAPLGRDQAARWPCRFIPGGVRSPCGFSAWAWQVQLMP
jgi:hypothetical protein